MANMKDKKTQGCPKEKEYNRCIEISSKVGI